MLTRLNFQVTACVVIAAMFGSVEFSTTDADEVNSLTVDELCSPLVELWGHPPRVRLGATVDRLYPPDERYPNGVRLNSTVTTTWLNGVGHAVISEQMRVADEKPFGVLSKEFRFSDGLCDHVMVKDGSVETLTRSSQRFAATVLFPDSVAVVCGLFGARLEPFHSIWTQGTRKLLGEKQPLGGEVAIELLSQTGLGITAAFDFVDARATLVAFEVRERSSSGLIRRKVFRGLEIGQLPDGVPFIQKYEVTDDPGGGRPVISSAVTVNDFEWLPEGDGDVSFAVKIPEGQAVNVVESQWLRHEWRDGKVVQVTDPDAMKRLEQFEYSNQGIGWRKWVLSGVSVALIVIAGWLIRRKSRTAAVLIATTIGVHSAALAQVFADPQQSVVPVTAGAGVEAGDSVTGPAKSSTESAGDFPTSQIERGECSVFSRRAATARCRRLQPPGELLQNFKPQSDDRKTDRDTLPACRSVTSNTLAPRLQELASEAMTRSPRQTGLIRNKWIRNISQIPAPET